MINCTMSDKEHVGKYIKGKKRKKRVKKLVIVFIVLGVGGTIFVTKAPMFNINSIALDGVSKNYEANMQDTLSQFVGKNIFTVNTSEIENAIKQNKYVKNISITRKGISSLKIAIEEESPIYYILKDNKYYIINDDFTILEAVDSIDGRDLVQILGVEGNNYEVGSVLTDSSAYANALQAFHPYISQNKESIKLDYLDLTEIVAIKGKIGNVDIRFGDETDLHNKMENVYRILLSDSINLKNGYIDVSFDGPPVYKETSSN